MRWLPIVGGWQRRSCHGYGARQLAVLLLVLLGLTACKGGGGGGGEASDDGPIISTSRTSPSALAAFFVESFGPFEETARSLIEEAPRYLRQRIDWYKDLNNNGRYDPGSEDRLTTYSLKSAGIHYAHAAGLSGAGQIIAFTDSGFLATHEAFAGKTIWQSDGVGISDHGTAVASVAAGSSGYMVGVAPGADLAFGSFATFETRTEATRLAHQLGAVAQNNSWGFVGASATRSAYDTVFSSAASRNYLSALRTYSQEGVVIFAASNDDQADRAGLMSALPRFEPTLEAGWLAVINGAADLVGDDVVGATRISSACLEAAAWCLAAEGAWTAATSDTANDYGFWVGTSFAAPTVAGAMALLGEAFPNLSPHGLRTRLLASADNEFAGFNATGEVELAEGFRHAISDEWGHGFLDVKAALLPIGETTATMADGSTYNVTQPLVVEGSASGDAVARALQGVSLVASDSLQANFSIPASNLVARRDRQPVIEGLGRKWLIGEDHSCCGLDQFYQDTLHLAGSGPDLSIGLMLPPAASQDANFGMVIGRTFQSGSAEISFDMSLGRDTGQLLPKWHSGEGSTIMAAEVSLAAPITPLTEIGLSAALGGRLAGYGDQTESTTFNSASAELTQRSIFGAGDRLSFTLGLPVAVSRGRTEVTLPVITRSGNAGYQNIEVDLAPQGRELRVGIEYHYPLGPAADVLVSALHIENVGNVSGDSSNGVFVGFRSRF